MSILVRTIYFIIFTLINFLITYRGGRIKKTRSEYINLILAFAVLEVFCLFLLYKLTEMPAVHSDESVGMYDGWSLAKWGIDSNLISHPVYLQSVFGQGQSILYVLLARPFLSVLGYHLFAFRMPIVIVSSGSLLFLFYVFSKGFKRAQDVFILILVLASSPWLLSLSRWGMDCNISPFPIIIGFGCLLLGARKTSHDIKQWLLYLVGMMMIALSAYAYNVAWMFLPIIVPLFLIILWVKQKINLKQLAGILSIIALEIIPILTFVVRSNIPNLNHEKRILFWTSPKLSQGRIPASFIDLHSHIWHHILVNLDAFLKMMLTGTDKLPWNSIPGFGAYYLFALPFFLVGLINIFKRRSIFEEFIMAMLVACVPMILLIKPNFNHLMFLHFPVLLTIAIGINTILQTRIPSVKFGIIFSYLIMFLLFSGQYFAKTRYPHTGWNVAMKKTLNNLHLKQYKKIYFISQDSQFLLAIRFFDPASPYQFQKTKDHPYVKGNFPQDKYLNFQRVMPNTDLNLQDNSLILVDQNDLINFKKTGEKYKFKKAIELKWVKYYVYETGK